MIKRTFDILVSFILLIVLSPVMAFVAWKVAKNLGKPVVFIQPRPGLNGQVFNMYKFRSMRNAVDDKGNTLPDSERLTSFGKQLRASSLDELPGLWNVFKGDMSLVGPRPLLVEYLPLYSTEQARRHHVKPGLTGWAQVNGRNAIDWPSKFKLDVWYVDNQSLWLDVKILFMTVKKVFTKADINAKDEVTISKFTGNHHE